jgi:hypothetical protein
MSELVSNIKVALKQNLIPGLYLQVFAVSLALMYFFWPAASGTFEYFASLKATYGWKYALVSTSLFGGIIPYLYLLYKKQIPKYAFRIFLFYALFWAYKGVEVDFLYTMQAHWFGNNADIETIVKKVMVDQFVYGTLWAAPSMAIGYLWKEQLFNWQAFKQRVNRRFVFLTIPTTMVSGWLIWVPANAVTYAMPLPLQIPLFNLVLCFFVLLLTSISRPSNSESSDSI